MNDRRKSSGNGKEEYFEEVNGKRLYDWEDIWYAVGSHSIGGGPPTIDFGTNNSPRYGIKLYKMCLLVWCGTAKSESEMKEESKSARRRDGEAR